MQELKDEESTVKKIYGKEDLKEILTSLLEKTFIENFENIENFKK